MRRLTLLIILSCMFCEYAIASDMGQAYTLYLVRHAEKASDGSHDPRLTQAGQRRARQLSDWFQDKNIREIFSSDYHRTRDTAEPLVSSLGLELIIYDPQDLATLSAQLLDNKTNALVVGHSNTTPDLARLLCDCEIDDMDESEYDRLIVVSVVDGETRITTLRQGDILP